MNHYHGSPVTDIVESQSHSQSQSLFDNDQSSKPREPVTDHMWPYQVQPAGVVLGCELLRGQGFPGELKVGGSFATNEFEQNKIEIPEVSDSWLKFNKFNCNCSTQFHFVPFFIYWAPTQFHCHGAPTGSNQTRTKDGWYVMVFDRRWHSSVSFVLFCWSGHWNNLILYTYTYKTYKLYILILLLILILYWYWYYDYETMTITQLQTDFDLPIRSGTWGSWPEQNGREHHFSECHWSPGRSAACKRLGTNQACTVSLHCPPRHQQLLLIVVVWLQLQLDMVHDMFWFENH